VVVEEDFPHFSGSVGWGAWARVLGRQPWAVP